MKQNKLHDCVRASMEDFFRDLNGTDPDNLLEVVMAQAQHNQSRAAQWLGLNRNTLRKKLLEHKLLD